jgi:DNA-binding NarL/FixJ family response regulator
VELALRLKPDVVVLDLTMPEKNGLETIQQLRQELPQTELLVFSMHDSDELIREVFAAGARGLRLEVGCRASPGRSASFVVATQAVLYFSNFGSNSQFAGFTAG